MTYGNGRRRLFINGKLLDEIEVSAPIPPSTQSLTVAARGDLAEWFQGKIDHVAIYRQELPTAAVRSHYRAFRHAIGGGAAAPERFAWRALCQSLFCLNEFMYLE